MTGWAPCWRRTGEAREAGSPPVFAAKTNMSTPGTFQRSISAGPKRRWSSTGPDLLFAKFNVNSATLESYNMINHVPWAGAGCPAGCWTNTTAIYDGTGRQTG